jgi:hypothetical protein
MRRHYGYMIFFDSSENSPILAKSGRLKAIYRSSTVAEISGVDELASELLWVIVLKECPIHRRILYTELARHHDGYIRISHSFPVAFS